MKKRLLLYLASTIMAFALILSGCGEAGTDSSEQTQGAVQSDSKGEEKLPSKDDAPASGSAEASASGSEASDVIRSDRHFYKTVVFSGNLNIMYHNTWMNPPLGYPADSDSAVILDYDTATGKIERTRVCVYCHGYDEESRKADEESNINEVLEYVGYTLSGLPYTTENFYYNNDKVIALIWELPEDFDYTAFDVEMRNRFFTKNPTAEPQNIDGLINDVLYKRFNNMAGKPYPVFGSNYFWYFCPDMQYTVAWYDTAWNVEMYDPAVEYKNLHPDTSMSWSPEDYGSTSYNTGGGYTGTYRYEDGLK